MPAYPEAPGPRTVAIRSAMRRAGIDRVQIWSAIGDATRVATNKRDLPDVTAVIQSLGWEGLVITPDAESTSAFYLTKGTP